MTDDTIAAIATPIGEGGLAVIRVSGPDALKIVDAGFEPVGKTSRKPSQADSHTIHYGYAVGNGLRLDEVLISIMKAPRTFTREDVVEITCHGGLLPAHLILDAVLANGARIAEPGEFTRRAFLNGRIDLTQAEAVADLIHSRTELALQAANEQLAGKLSARIGQLRESLLKTLAHIEAHIDFPDEDIAPDTREQLAETLANSVRFMDGLLRTAGEGQILRRGVRAAIVGRANAGKSSLLNCLLEKDRAIVSPVPGTTRDTIEETANIRGIPVVFIDTAGFRESADEVEAEGIRRSRSSIQQAEIILHVIDSSVEWEVGDEKYLAETSGKKRLIICNKIDLIMPSERRNIPLQPSDSVREIAVSCRTGSGIEQLKDAIKEMIWAGEVKAEMLQVMINSRHQDALNRAKQAVMRALEAFRADATLELIAADCRIGVSAVGEIVGKTTTEDLLDVIFSQFCIGK